MLDVLVVSSSLDHSGVGSPDSRLFDVESPGFDGFLELSPLPLSENSKSSSASKFSRSRPVSAKALLEPAREPAFCMKYSSERKYGDVSSVLASRDSWRKDAGSEKEFSRPSHCTTLDLASSTVARFTGGASGAHGKEQRAKA